MLSMRNCCLRGQLTSHGMKLFWILAKVAMWRSDSTATNTKSAQQSEWNTRGSTMRWSTIVQQSLFFFKKRLPKFHSICWATKQFLGQLRAIARISWICFCSSEVCHGKFVNENVVVVEQPRDFFTLPRFIFPIYPAILSECKELDPHQSSI